MRRVRKAGAALIAVLALGARAVGAQAIGRGFEFERAGRPADAAALYLTTVHAEPANLGALLGLERVLPQLNRLPELLPLVHKARVLDPGNTILRGLELRTYAGLRELDSVEAVGRRWAAESPTAEVAYREWLLALADAREFAAARDVIVRARTAIRGPGTLAIEAAELERRLGQWEAAAREWRAAVAINPAAAPNAAGQLGDAPDSARSNVIRGLTGDGGGAPASVGPPAAAARRLAAELLIGWGKPMDGWVLLEMTLAQPTPETVAALRRFADLAGGGGSAPDMRRARGLALARFAELVPPPLSSRARADAARALLDGGDRAAARIVLEQIVADQHAVPDAQALAQASLVRILVEDNQVDLAAARLAELGERIREDDRAELRLALARARIRRGELDLADSVLARDSSVAALAVRGWVALYRGELAQAVERFRAAGPYAGDRREATERTAILALLQGIRERRHPELGAALLLLARGDSAGAVAALRRAADGFQAGRPDVVLLAGRVAARLGGAQDSVAVGLFAEVVRTGGTGAAAPAAELEWARLLLRQLRPAEAIPHLERLILTYPGSAFVPEARRELERAKGAIPRS